MGIVLIFGSYFGVKRYIEDRNKDRNLELITITVSYDPDNCNENSPLHIKISNGSDKILNQFQYKLSAKRQGFSNNVIERQYESYTSYKIIEPGKGAKKCSGVPEITAGSAPDLIWEVSLYPYGTEFEEQ